MISSPLQLANLTKTQPPLLSPDMLWSIAIDELQHQMLRATFNAWLLDSHLIRRASHPTFLAIAVRNPYAQAWLHHHLHPIVYNTLTAVAGYPLTLCFIAKPSVAPWLPKQNNLSSKALIRAFPYSRPHLLSTTPIPPLYLENPTHDPTISQYPCPHLQPYYPNPPP